MNLKFKFFFVIFIWIFFPLNAYAYIDPGTGSLILQALIAGGITAMIFIRNFRDKVISFFRRNKKEKE